jgi:hypothetical protein
MERPARSLCQSVGVDESQLREAFSDVLDQAVVFHGFSDYLRDYDVYVYATADPRTGINPEHLRYRFTHCVRATVTTAVRRDVWSESVGDQFTDYDRWLQAGEPEGYVWGVKWQALYPGIQLMPPTDETRDWSSVLGLPVYEALIETNGHNISLVFSDLEVTVVEPGLMPFVVPAGGPDGKIPL